MKWTRSAAILAVAVSGFLGLFAISCSQQSREAAQPAATAMDPVARGKYLSIIAGCNDCHTPGSLYGQPDTTRLLSGSELGWEGPWGVTFPRNLTPDEETGLGTWSEDDIVQALRTGKKKDGSPILPPMPWQDFAQMNDEDIHALAAYLKSIPPVKHKAPDVIPPTAKATGARLSFPPPPAWDAQNLKASPEAAKTP
jgi:mono/diheme cytochrome c family protein